MIAIAWAALFAWPVVALVLFRNLSLPVAAIATILGGYLLLPSGISLDLPLLPSLNKFTLPAIVALALTMVMLRQNPQNMQVETLLIPRSMILRMLILLLCVGIVGTVLTNTDPVVYGPLVLRELRPYDAASMLMKLFVGVVPFFLGRLVLASPEAQRTFLKGLAISAVLYAVPALWEVRMSPQLHVQLYGFFPSSFMQQMRGDGFRPVVFVNHGLALALFFVFGMIAAAVLAREAKGNERILWMSAVVWLLVVLVLCKSLGPLMIAAVLLPVALFLSPRMQALAAFCIAMVLITYPVLRSADLIPVDRVLAFVETINPARARSFEVRLVNEENLFAKAQQRPVFGWGEWGRQRIYNAQGRDISLTDGSWVITLGVGGWVRYIGIYGLLCWPVIALFLKRREKLDPICVGMMLVLCVKLIDLMPNPAIGAIAWFCAGGLAGRLEMKIRKEESSPQRASYSRKRRPASAYARYFPGTDDEFENDHSPDLRDEPSHTKRYSRLHVPRSSRT